MPKWTLVNGKFEKQDNHTPENPPIRGIIPGEPPAVRVGNLGGWRRHENLRRFDRPDAHQIRGYEQEDNERTRKQMDIEPVVYQSKQELESGKIRINSDVIKVQDKMIVPHASVVDDRGITHVLPLDKIPEEKISVTIGRTQEGNLPSRVTQKQLIEMGIQAVKSGTNHNRTVG